MVRHVYLPLLVFSCGDPMPQRELPPPPPTTRAAPALPKVVQVSSSPGLVGQTFEMGREYERLSVQLVDMSRALHVVDCIEKSTEQTFSKENPFQPDLMATKAGRECAAKTKALTDEQVVDIAHQIRDQPR